jgi:hypothetical protein
LRGGPVSKTIGCVGPGLPASARFPRTPGQHGISSGAFSAVGASGRNRKTGLSTRRRLAGRPMCFSCGNVGGF